MREINQQFERFKTRPNYIFHASTSGGTQAGMIAGCQLFGDGKTKVIGVSPDDSADEIQTRVARIVNGIYDKLEIPGPETSADEITVLDSYIGDGYGIETAAGREATKLLARSEGVILDPVYTAKAMAGLLDWIERGKLKADDNVLFWHTGGQLALFYAPAANDRE